MNYFDAAIFGIVEGLTEFLPISSTGHLMLTAKLLGGQTEFLKTFEIVIQLGAILSVIVLYWQKFLLDFAVLKRVIAAFIPTAVIGFLFYKIVKNVLMESDAVVLWALAIGGIAIIAFELVLSRKMRRKDSVLIKNENGGVIANNVGIEKISYQKALLIGVFQAIAIIPGVSRAAATIIGGLALGIKRRVIVEFSFLLAVPTMLAASCLDLYKNASLFSFNQFNFLAIGFIVSFLTAMLAIKFFLKFIKRHTFIGFGIYRILIVLVFVLIFSVLP